MKLLLLIGGIAAAVAIAGLSQSEVARQVVASLGATRQAVASPNRGDPERNRSLAAALAAASREQVALARLAAERSNQEPVRDYARQVIAGRETMERQLATSEQAAGAPAEPPAQLASLQGRAFNRAYLDATIQEQQQILALCRAAAREGPSPTLTALGNSQLPGLRRELERAHELAAVAALAPPDDATPPPVHHKRH